MRRLLTTSTGLPKHTAKNPAPSPESKWHTTLSSNIPVFSSVCLICTGSQGGD